MARKKASESLASFLRRITAELHGRGLKTASFRYQQIKPFGVQGIVVTFAGVPGRAEIVPTAVDRGVKSWGQLAAEDVTHLSIYFLDEDSEYEESFVSDHYDAIARWLLAWRDLFQPAKRLTPTPIERDELTRLDAIAEARRQASARIVQVAVDGRVPGFHLPEAASMRLLDDLKHLSSGSVATNFPRDDDGRLPLGVQVLLASCECNDRLSKDRQLWLTASSPQKRREPQEITVKLEALIEDNHPHRWNNARWHWDTRRLGDGETIRWGVGRTVLRHVRFGSPAQMSRLERRKSADLSETERISLCILRQDAGRFEDALRLFGVGLGDEARDVLAGKPLSVHDYYAVEPWKLTMRRALWESAPWLFRGALRQAHEQLLAKRRRRDEVSLRLFALPHQHHQQKVSLMLVGESSDGAVRLDIDCTGSNQRLAETLWKRPVEMDLLRLGSVRSQTSATVF